MPVLMVEILLLVQLVSDFELCCDDCNECMNFVAQRFADYCILISFRFGCSRIFE